MGLFKDTIRRIRPRFEEEVENLMPILPPGLPRDLRLPPRGRPIPPISIGGIGGGVPSELLPIKGGPQPIPKQPINVPGGGGINYGIPDSFTPLTGSANERGPIIPPPIDLPPPRPLQPIDRQELKPFVQPIMGKPLVPGSAPPREQTGLTAAELLELSDEEL